MNWIDAKIELPPNNENVIVHCPGASEEIWLGYFWAEDNKWTDAAFGEVIDVTHWMAMPSLPETSTAPQCDGLARSLTGEVTFES